MRNDIPQLIGLESERVSALMFRGIEKPAEFLDFRTGTIQSGCPDVDFARAHH